MFVAALMTKNPVTVLPETTLADAARIMLARRISGLPVMDETGRLVGMVTEGDMLRRAELGTQGSRPGWLKALLLPASLAADYVRTRGRKVGEVMTASPVSVTPETDLAEVTNLMLHKHIKRLPVLQDGALVGVISRSDLMRVLALKLIEIPSATSDAGISTHIESEMAAARWAPQSGIRVNVADQVVYLDGVVFSDAERQAVKVIAENAPGVTQVRDNLVFVDPGSGMAFPVA